MRSPLLRALVEDHGYLLLKADNLQSFIESNHEVVLFFSENPSQFPEASDVAVILPELMKVYGSRLTAGLVDASIERDLQAQLRFSGWPALVFMRDGEYLGAITKVQDWNVYLSEIDQILTAKPSQPPAFDLAAACACQ